MEKKRKLFSLFLGIIIFSSVLSIHQSQARWSIFDETWYGESLELLGPVHVSLQIQVFGDQDVKVTATYSNDSDAHHVFFEYIEVWVQGVYWQNQQEDVPTSGGTGSAEQTGDLTQFLWEMGASFLIIVVGLAFSVSQTMWFATQGLVIFHFGIGFCAFDEVEFLNHLGYTSMRRGPRF